MRFCDEWQRSGPSAGVARRSILKKFLADESGATAIEYGLIAAGISLVIIAAVNGIGGKLSEKFGLIDTKLAPAASQPEARVSGDEGLLLFSGGKNLTPCGVTRPRKLGRVFR